MEWYDIKQLIGNKQLKTINQIIIDNQITKVNELDNYFGVKKGIVSNYLRRKNFIFKNGLYVKEEEVQEEEPEEEVQIKESYENIFKKEENKIIKNDFYQKANELALQESTVITIKINSKNNKKIKEYLKLYKRLYKQDIINIALEEFVKKYDL